MDVHGMSNINIVFIDVCRHPTTSFPDYCAHSLPMKRHVSIHQLITLFVRLFSPIIGLCCLPIWPLSSTSTS
ncbi:unnamed protein product [Ectocarpus sp. CCAP 1310/34]|nr:unnamed protein product [Ectocarpus sp. CCAP 1310/34]